jgi:AcrR family transcriptional regulator
MAIARTEGFGAVRMRRMAQELSVWPQAVYNYVPTQERLLESVAEAALRARRPVPASPTASWEDLVRARSASVVEVLDEFSGLADFLISRPLFLWSTELTGLVEDGLTALQDTGLDDAGILHAFTTINAHLLGHRQLYDSQRRAAAAQPGADLLATLGRHPTLTRLLPAMLEQNLDKSYTVGLNLIIAGIREQSQHAARTDRRAGSRRGSPRLRRPGRPARLTPSAEPEA